MKKNTDAGSNVVTIRRHGNRRLYNTAARQYVSLADLAAIVREGRDVHVVDSASGDDVTKAVLIQVVLEEEKNGQTILPVEFLFQILRTREETVIEFFRHHLATSFNAFLATKAEFDEKIRSVLQSAISVERIFDVLTPGVDSVREVILGKEKPPAAPPKTKRRRQK